MKYLNIEGLSGGRIWSEGLPNNEILQTEWLSDWGTGVFAINITGEKGWKTQLRAGEECLCRSCQHTQALPLAVALWSPAKIITDWLEPAGLVCFFIFLSKNGLWPVRGLGFQLFHFNHLYHWSDQSAQHSAQLKHRDVVTCYRYINRSAGLHFINKNKLI